MTIFWTIWPKIHRWLWVAFSCKKTFYDFMFCIVTSFSNIFAVVYQKHSTVKSIFVGKHSTWKCVAWLVHNRSKIHVKSRCWIMLISFDIFFMKKEIIQFFYVDNVKITLPSLVFLIFWAWMCIFGRHPPWIKTIYEL